MLPVLKAGSECHTPKNDLSWPFDTMDSLTAALRYWPWHWYSAALPVQPTSDVSEAVVM